MCCVDSLWCLVGDGGCLKCWSLVGQLLVNLCLAPVCFHFCYHECKKCWSVVGHLLVNCWSISVWPHCVFSFAFAKANSVGQLLVTCWPIVGQSLFGTIVVSLLFS